MSNSVTYDLAIVGGGIVGAATFYQIQKKYPHLKIALFEKEPEVGKHQTGRNSGVIHSGIYYKPGSLKAENCKEGRFELIEFAKAHNIPYDMCGKVIVATKPEELPALENIYKRGIENKIEHIYKIGPKEIQEIEPFCTNAIAGLQVTCTGIIDYVTANQKMLEVAQTLQAESRVFFNTEVVGIKRDAIIHLMTNKGDFQAKYLISCGGLQSDRIAEKTEHTNIGCKIVPFRGDYYDLTEQATNKVKHLIYPVPDPNFPFLGVHFTRMIKGGVECGPNAVFSFKREGYSRTSFSFKDAFDSLTYLGTWKLFSKHWRAGLEEYKRAFSKKLFLRSLQVLIPSLTDEDITPARAGVRAQALEPNGNLVDDFKLITGDRTIHVINAPSPAATASLAIGKKILEMGEKQFNWGN